MQRLIGTWNPARGVWETDTMDLLSEHSEPFSATWPSSGTTRSGVAFELPTPALPTAGTGSSSSRGLPTPTAMDSEASGGSSAANVTLTDAVVRTEVGSRENPRHLLPTPMTSEARGIGLHGQGSQDLRTTIALLKTPLSNLGQNGGSQHPDKRRAGGHGPTLADEVEHLLPTPTTMAGGQATRSGARSNELLLPGIARAVANGDRTALLWNAGSESPDE